jgi:hypothetical protein
MFIELQIYTKEPHAAEINGFTMLQVESVIRVEAVSNHCRLRLADSSSVEVNLSYENFKAIMARTGAPLMLSEGNKENDPYFQEMREREAKRSSPIAQSSIVVEKNIPRGILGFKKNR